MQSCTHCINLVNTNDNTIDIHSIETFYFLTVFVDGSRKSTMIFCPIVKFNLRLTTMTRQKFEINKNTHKMISMQCIFACAHNNIYVRILTWLLVDFGHLSHFICYRENSVNHTVRMQRLDANVKTQKCHMNYGDW